MISNPDSVSSVVSRLRRAYRERTGREFSPAVSLRAGVTSRLERVVFDVLSRLDWPPKSRLKSGIYSEKEYRGAWATVDSTPAVAERRKRLKEIESQLKK